MVQFDPTISLGSLLTAVGFFGGGLAFLWSMKVELRVLSERQVLVASQQDKRLELVEQRLGDVTAVLTQVARQEERLNDHERRIIGLAHGEGYILPLHKSPYEKS